MKTLKLFPILNLVTGLLVFASCNSATKGEPQVNEVNSISQLDSISANSAKKDTVINDTISASNPNGLDKNNPDITK